MKKTLITIITSQRAWAQHPAVKAPKDTAKGENTTAKSEIEKPTSPPDEYNRGTPRSCVEGFIAATRDGKFDTASKYLDLTNLPLWMDANEGPELARKLKIVLDRAFWLDPLLISMDPNGAQNDGPLHHRDLLSNIFGEPASLKHQ